MKDDSHYLKRASKIGPDVERLTLILLKQGNGFIDTRKIWGILSLDKKYPSDRINRACRDAIDRNEFSYRTVVGLLNLQMSKNPNESVLPNEKSKMSASHKFVRSLTEYQEELGLMH